VAFQGNQPFLFNSTGSIGYDFDPLANAAEISGNNALYNVTGFGGISGNVTVPIDARTSNISPALTTLLGGVPLWVWLGIIGAAFVYVIKKK